jgi:hypothetical protein
MRKEQERKLSTDLMAETNPARLFQILIMYIFNQHTHTLIYPSGRALGGLVSMLGRTLPKELADMLTTAHEM